MKHSLHGFSLILLTAAIQNANATAIPANDSASMSASDGSVDIPVLDNDSSNAEDSELQGLSIVQTSDPAYGSTVINEDGTITYVPDENFFGQDMFTYDVIDGTGYGGSATVFVEVTESSDRFEPYAVGPTNKAVANMLDEFCYGPNETISEAQRGACSDLVPYTDFPELLNEILREIAPEEALTQRGLLAENSRNKTSRIYQALAHLRAASPASLSINDTAVPLGGAAGDNLGSPWTLLSSIQIEDFERNQTGNQAGYDSSARGLMLGLGYRMSGNLSLGGAFDWAAYDLDYVRNGGDLDSDIYSLTGFMAWYRGNLGVDLQAGYSQGESKAQRRFTFPIVAYADSRYDSSQTNLSGQLDWGWQRNAWALRPFLRLDYLNSEIDAFTETGDSLWLTAAEKQAHEQLNTSAGLDTRYTINYAWGVMVPGVKLSLVNQANLRNSPVAFQLVDADSGFGRFELRADSADSLFYQWDLSTVFVLANGLSTFVGAQVLSGYDHVSAYQLSGGVHWEF